MSFFVAIQKLTHSLLRIHSSFLFLVPSFLPLQYCRILIFFLLPSLLLLFERCFRGSLHGGATTKVEKAHFAASKQGPENSKYEVRFDPPLCRALKHPMICLATLSCNFVFLCVCVREPKGWQKNPDAKIWRVSDAASVQSSKHRKLSAPNRNRKLQVISNRRGQIARRSHKSLSKMLQIALSNRIICDLNPFQIAASSQRPTPSNR